MDGGEDIGKAVRRAMVDGRRGTVPADVLGCQPATERHYGCWPSGRYAVTWRAVGRATEAARAVVGIQCARCSGWWMWDGDPADNVAPLQGCDCGQHAPAAHLTDRAAGVMARVYGVAVNVMTRGRVITPTMVPETAGARHAANL